MNVLGEGKVDLIDYMGTDLTVVNAARVSFNKESEWGLDFDAIERLKSCPFFFWQIVVKVLTIRTQNG